MSSHKSCKTTISLLLLIVAMVGYSIYQNSTSENFIKYQTEGLDSSQRAVRIKEGLSDFSKKYLQKE